MKGLVHPPGSEEQRVARARRRAPSSEDCFDQIRGDLWSVVAAQVAEVQEVRGRDQAAELLETKAPRAAAAYLREGEPVVQRSS